MRENVILLPPKEDLNHLYSQGGSDIPMGFFVSLAEMIMVNHKERLIFEKFQKEEQNER